jgi:hypothetical protein
LTQASACAGIDLGRHFEQQITGKLRRESGVEQVAKRLRLDRFGARGLAPGKAGELLFDDAAQRANLLQHRRGNHLRLDHGGHCDRGRRRCWRLR